MQAEITDCKTKYPIVMVHGTGFRDRKYLNYWGRIPKLLEHRGSVLFYGNQDSWATVENNAETVRKSIEDALCETGAEKVNIIAHSKGGIEARYIISTLGMADSIASLTTIATPHHGSKTMDKVCRLPKWLFRIASFFINLWFRLLGDDNPDFHGVCRQFTTGYAAEFNAKNLDSEKVYYQSYTAVMKNCFSDIILFIPFCVIKAVEGENDGLVTVDSARWGNFKGVWRGVTRRGISHADEVDMRRRRLSKKVKPERVDDICDRYVEMVSALAEMGF